MTETITIRTFQREGWGPQVSYRCSCGGHARKPWALYYDGAEQAKRAAYRHTQTRHAGAKVKWAFVDTRER